MVNDYADKYNPSYGNNNYESKDSNSGTRNLFLINIRS